MKSKIWGTAAPGGAKNPKSRGGIRALDDRARDDETDASRINRDARCVAVPVNATGVFRGASRAEGTRARARSRRARAAGFSSSIPRRGGRRGRKPPPRDLVVASDSIASRARGCTRDARRVARHERRAVGSRTRRSRLGGPGGDHAGTRPSRRVGEPETRGTATTRRHAVRGRGMRKVNSVGWHSPCLLRSTLRASATRRQVKRGGGRCWRCSCISSRWKSILCFSALFSHTGPVRDPPIKQLNTYSLLLHY